MNKPNFRHCPEARFLVCGYCQRAIKKNQNILLWYLSQGHNFSELVCVFGGSAEKRSYVCLELSRAARTSSRFYLSICNQLGERHMTSISKTICDERKRQRPAMQLDLLEQEQLEDCVGIFILIQYNWVWEICSQRNFSFTGNAFSASLLMECIFSGMSLCLWPTLIKHVCFSSGILCIFTNHIFGIIMTLARNIFLLNCFLCVCVLITGKEVENAQISSKAPL